MTEFPPLKPWSRPRLRFVREPGKYVFIDDDTGYWREVDLTEAAALAEDIMRVIHAKLACD